MLNCYINVKTTINIEIKFSLANFVLMIHNCDVLTPLLSAKTKSCKYACISIKNLITYYYTFKYLFYVYYPVFFKCIIK